MTETETSLTALRVWDYVPLDVDDRYGGDVQRLPNGNTLVVHSEPGLIREVTSDEAVVQTLETGRFGYVNFRETLYGPPLR